MQFSLSVIVLWCCLSTFMSFRYATHKAKNSYLKVAVPNNIIPSSTVTAEVAQERSAPAEGTMFRSPLFRIVDALFSVPLIHDLLFGVYRRQVVQKSEDMGLPWSAIMQQQRDMLPQLKQLASQLRNPSTVVPDYYYAQVHAYPSGNLCWDSALEEDLWSKLMIAPLYGNALDGDVQMRAAWLQISRQAVDRGGAGQDGLEGVRSAADLGCGTGLSMYMLDSVFPALQSVQGVDLSLHKLAVCAHKKTEMSLERAAKFTLLHENAVATSLRSASQDLVSICLVCHESPLQVSRDLLREAFRVLRPGGFVTVLDLDKHNLESLLTNPFVAAVYRRTEPYMGDFVALSIADELKDAGFETATQGQASRSHKVFVARKPA